MSDNENRQNLTTLKGINWNNVLTFFAVLIAALSVCLVYYMWNEDRKLLRPYFYFDAEFKTYENPFLYPGPVALENAGITDGDALGIKFIFRNVGKNPARNSYVAMYFVNVDNNELYQDPGESIMINDIPADKFFVVNSFICKMSENVPGFNLLVALKYDDPITQKAYHQRFYYSWDGVKDRYFQPYLNYAQPPEKQILEDIFRKFFVKSVHYDKNIPEVFQD